MTKLQIGEFMRVLSPALDNKAFGLSFVDVNGEKTTYWVIRDHRGVFQRYASGVQY